MDTAAHCGVGWTRPDRDGLARLESGSERPRQAFQVADARESLGKGMYAAGGRSCAEC